MPDKINCGVTKLKKGERYGTAQECLEKGQVKYYGRFAAPAGLLGEDLVKKAKKLTKAQKKALIVTKEQEEAEHQRELEQIKKEALEDARAHKELKKFLKEEALENKRIKEEAELKRLEDEVRQAVAKAELDETKKQRALDRKRDEKEAKAKAKEQAEKERLDKLQKEREEKKQEKTLADTRKRLELGMMGKAFEPHVGHDLHPEKLEKCRKEVAKLEKENLSLQNEVVDMQNDKAIVDDKMADHTTQLAKRMAKIRELEEDNRHYRHELDVLKSRPHETKIDQILRKSVSTLGEYLELVNYSDRITEAMRDYNTKINPPRS